MPRLLRPHIPVETRCRVALRQLGEMWPDAVIEEHRRTHGKLLASLLERLAALLACAPADLRLDHDPALGAREKVFRRGEHVGYRPDANDPEHLRYRPHGPEHEESPLIKTNVRGDHGQYPDRVLIARQRKREQPRAKKTHKNPGLCKTPKRWPSRPFPKGK